MSRVRSKDTKPELAVRRIVFGMGFRYRLHRRDLPGKPDLAFPGRRKVIFVHGCFWHGHEDCRLAKVPKSNSEFWAAKFISNRERDRRNIELLHALGWTALVIWQCDLKDLERTTASIYEFLTQRVDRPAHRS